MSPELDEDFHTDRVGTDGPHLLEDSGAGHDRATALIRARQGGTLEVQAAYGRPVPRRSLPKPRNLQNPW